MEGQYKSKLRVGNGKTTPPPFGDEGTSRFYEVL